MGWAAGSGCRAWWRRANHRDIEPAHAGQRLMTGCAGARGPDWTTTRAGPPSISLPHREHVSTTSAIFSGPPTSVSAITFVSRRSLDHLRATEATNGKWNMADDKSGLTLPIAKARGFSVRRHEPPSEVLQWLPERSLLRGGSGVPRPTYPHPGHLTTCQVVQVHGLVLATLGSRSWLMFSTAEDEARITHLHTRN